MNVISVVRRLNREKGENEMNKSKAAIVVSSIIEKIEMICGGLWTAFFVLGFFGTITDESDDGVAFGIFVIVCIALGVYVFLCGRKRKKMRLLFKDYVAQLSVDPSGLIENIAGATGTSVDVVKKNLAFMIKKKFFTNARIDEVNNQLVLPSMARRQQEQNYNAQASNVSTSAPQIEMTTCKCPNCGGMNKIAKGMVAECDFCGSPLQG